MANGYGYRYSRRRSIFFPLLLIVVGSLFLLRNSGIYMPIGHLFAQYWPVILIGWGVVRLLEYAWARQHNEPAPRTGGGSIALIILLIVFGTAAQKSTHMNWNQIGDEVGVDDDVMGMMGGNAYPYSDEVEHAFLEGQTLKVVCDRGDIKVHPGEAGTVKVVAHKKVMADSEPEARKLSDESKPTITVENGVVTINANTMAQGNGIQFGSGIRIGPRVSSDLDVYVPAKAAVQVDTGHGGIVVSDREGDLEASNAHGNSTVENISGNVSLTVHHGSVKVSKVKGNVKVDGRVDDTDIADVSGTVNMSGEYPNSVKLSNIGEGATFRSSVTDLKMGKLQGDLFLDGGDLRAKSLSGPFSVITRAKDIHLDDITGDIRVENSHGDVEVHSLSPLGSVDVVNQNGPIRVWVPQEAGFELDANVAQGEIENDFNVPSSSSGSTARATGTVGKGGPAMRLNTNHASIELHKEAAAVTSSSPKKAER